MVPESLRAAIRRMIMARSSLSRMEKIVRRLRKGRNRLRETMKSAGIIVAAMLLLITLSSPAHAVRCNEWLGLALNDRELRVKELIRELLNSPKAAQWTSINTRKIERCLVQ